MRWLVRAARSVAGVTSVEPAAQWQEAFSIRLDWPDGTHDLVHFRRTLPAATRSLRGVENFWRLGPIRPRCSVVAVSYRDWDLHRQRRDCRSPDCPTAVQPSADEPERAVR